MSVINRKTLEYLADLGKIKIKEKEEKKLLEDLEKILSYFRELEDIDTSKVIPLAGGSANVNVFRKDDKDESRNESSGHRPLGEKLIRAFPEEEKGFLKVPPVFE